MPNIPKKRDPKYYETVTRDHRSVHNAAARRIYFDFTEPPDGQPKHSKVLHMKTAKAIAASFLSNLNHDIARNSMWGWIKGTPLPAQDAKFPGTDMPQQPLVELPGDFLP